MDKKTCLAPMSSPGLQTIRLNTGTEPKVTHIFCSGVKMFGNTVPVLGLLRK